ncbi:hypothetical protein EYF80_058465 [Liparis tanakae]|uniref:Uncharacterized protein n=1 Tax=Liparis tanakae TaxID=230148 RepID=A0A4Z2ERH8_9TELE|nr:hypothetical protein EYF80_058465 [Liparis tanakae]
MASQVLPGLGHPLRRHHHGALPQREGQPGGRGRGQPGDVRVGAGLQPELRPGAGPRHRRAVRHDARPEGASRHVPRDAGGGHADPVHAVRRRQPHQRAAAGRALADAEARRGEPHQLPGRRRARHAGHPRAHQAAERRGPGTAPGPAPLRRPAPQRAPPPPCGPSVLSRSVRPAGGGEQSGRDGPPAVEEGGVSPRHHALAPDGVGHRAHHAEHQRRGDGALHRRDAAQPVPPPGGAAGHLQVRGHPGARQDARVAGGLGAVLRHHHAPQPAAAPGRSQDGRPPGRRPPEDGGAAQQDQRQVPRHHHGLPADPGLREPGEQGVCVCECVCGHQCVCVCV